MRGPRMSVTNNGAGDITVFVYGYLIDAGALPAAATSHVGDTVKALEPSR